MAGEPSVTINATSTFNINAGTLGSWLAVAELTAIRSADAANDAELLAISYARERLTWAAAAAMGISDVQPHGRAALAASDRPTLTIVPVGDHFDVSPDGVPSGAIDSFQLSTVSSGVVASLSIAGLRIESLAAMDDPKAAARRFLNGDDAFTLGDGDDRVDSLGGDDTVAVGGGDNVVHAGKGNDDVSAIGAASGRNSFFGDAGDDRLISWNGRDRLDGGSGDDWLVAYGGSDALKGGDGADRLEGRAGPDLLTGGRGEDVFKFYTTDSGATRTTRDTITDFRHGDDRIELTGFRIDGVFGDRLEFIGSGRFTDSGQVRWETVGHDLVIEVNAEGSRAADFAIFVEDTTTLSRADLIL